MRQLLVIFLAVACQVTATYAGWENFLCGLDPKNVFSPCNMDCQFNHGRVGGKCGDMKDAKDFNCYCDEALTDDLHEKFKINCGTPTDDVRNICTFDCLCNHAAIGGYCDFKRKACNCVGVGLNKRNLHCPAKSVREFAILSYNLMGTNVLGGYGVGFVQKALEKFPE